MGTGDGQTVGQSVHLQLGTVHPHSDHGSHRVRTAQGKQGKWSEEFPVRENPGTVICSSCKFPVSKDIFVIQSRM